jgi:hypothetical protein
LQSGTNATFLEQSFTIVLIEKIEFIKIKKWKFEQQAVDVQHSWVEAVD